MRLSIVTLLITLMPTTAAAQRPRAVLKGSYEDALQQNDADLARASAVCEKYGHLLSPPADKGAKKEVIADPRFFLLAEKSQTVLLARGNPKDVLTIVFIDANGGKLVAGTYRELKNGKGLNLTPSRVRKAISMVPKEEAQEFAASEKK